MKKNKFIVFTCGISLFTNAMHKPHDVVTSQGEVAHVSAFYTHPDEWRVRHELMKVVRAVPVGGFIGVDMMHLSDIGFIGALTQAASRGVKVEVNYARSSTDGYAKLKLLEKAGAQVKKVGDLHIKRVIISEGVPGVSELGKAHVFVGSYNVSPNAPDNFELMVLVQDDADYFLQNYRNHAAIIEHKSLASERFVRRKSPERAMIFSSEQFDLNASKRRRIERLADEPYRAGDMLDITVMALDDLAVAHSIQHVVEHNALVPIRIFVDGGKITANGRRLLDKIVTASNVSVYVFNAEQESRTRMGYQPLMHVKTLIRKTGDTVLVIVSTGNLTARGQWEHNIDAYFPGDPHLFKTIKIFNDYLVTLSVPYMFWRERHLPPSSQSSSSSSHSSYSLQ